MNNNKENFSYSSLINNPDIIDSSVIAFDTDQDKANLKEYNFLTERFSRVELVIAWLATLSFIAAYFFCYIYDIPYASLKHARTMYAVFVTINVLMAAHALNAWAKIPSRSIAKDSMLFFTISTVSAAIGNSVDYIFWVTEIANFKESVFTNLFFVLAILFALPAIHLLANACQVKLNRQPLFYYIAIIFIYALIPIIMNFDSFNDFYHFNNLKEFIFGLMYAIGLGYLAAVAMHLWRNAKGRLVYSARLMSLGMISMSFGCAIYAGLFPRIPSAEIPSSPVHIIIALGYVLAACSVKRTEKTLNTIFNLKSTKLPPWLTLVELFGETEGLEVYKRLEENIRSTLSQLVKAKEETEIKDSAINKLEHEINLRKKTEKALISAKEQAEEANEAKTQFLAMMSHELKTPLTAIKGYGALLSRPNLETVLQTNKLNEIAQQIVRNANNLHEMIDAILNFSQLENGKFTFRKQIFPVSNVLNYLDLIISEFHKSDKIEYIQNIPDKELKLNTDPHSLQHILSNLLINAFKFCEEGKVILTIRTSGKNDLYLAVEDTGIGIKANEIKYIFQPFYQISHGTRRKYGGTGLGLSIVKKIVDELQGTIELDSCLGKGSKFEIFLPDTIVKDKE
ncbi:MAG: sensor histidine kinase [Candidatus Rifleibacteriota bacterium]